MLPAPAPGQAGPTGHAALALIDGHGGFAEARMESLLRSSALRFRLLKGVAYKCCQLSLFGCSVRLSVKCCWLVEWLLYGLGEI